MKLTVKEKTMTRVVVEIALPTFDRYLRGGDEEVYKRGPEIIEHIHQNGYGHNLWKCVAGPSFLHNVNEQYRVGLYVFEKKETPPKKMSAPKKTKKATGGK